MARVSKDQINTSGYHSTSILGRIKKVQPNRKTFANRPPIAKTTVELKVPLCCEGCEENVRYELTTLDGVQEISVDKAAQKVVVSGDVTSSLILSRVRKIKNRAELWRKREGTSDGERPA